MQDEDESHDPRHIFQVSELNREVRALLEGHFPLIWVEGEISNLSRPASGHWYFTLKDSEAQVSCAMFRGRNRLVRFRPEQGMQVLVRARVSLYEQRGNFQLIVEHMEEAGHGALQRAFEALRERLAAEGLFDESRKQALPVFPACLGVITSPSGAVIRDILHVLQRRFPALPVLLYPVPVQGAEAVPALVEALQRACSEAVCDVLILARGGGSLEDLQAFNDERVARAIADCAIPVVSAVGHETDYTIADFVADLRAPTPSAAAELVSPDGAELAARCQGYRQALEDAMLRRLEDAALHLGHLYQRLRQQHPRRRLEQLMLRVDELEQRLGNGLRITLRHHRQRLDHLAARLRQQAPLMRLQGMERQCETLQQRLKGGMDHLLKTRRQQLQAVAGRLHAYSPLTTLERGYALPLTAEGRLLKSVRDTSAGDPVSLRLRDGWIDCRVEAIRPGED
ncbi:MAG: exodeoxyribonuclease VII large subunit [Gammaproteobacteria bacterium]|nr:MAG: exodeoxyribonuclease VII large subunit [Gammaproteobacteria bacterium]